jgi:hypothetical protein
MIPSWYYLAMDENKDEQPEYPDQTFPEQVGETPKVFVNGSYAVPTQPASTTLPQPPKKKFFQVRTPSQAFMRNLVILNLVVVGGPLLIIAYLNYLSKHGTSGTEFFGLLLFPVIPVMLCILIANLIFIPIYLIKSKPTLGRAILPALILLATLSLVVGNVYSATHQPKQKSPAQAAQDSLPSMLRSGQAPKDVSLEQATEMLDECKVSTFVGYNGDLTLVHKNSKGAIKQAEASSSGIYIATTAGSSSKLMYTSKALTPTLVPLARTAREKCASQLELRIYLDNTQEVKASDGSWQVAKDPSI